MAFPGVQLANAYKSFPKNISEVIVDSKLDGYRLLAVPDSHGSYRFYTRNGNSEPYTRNLQHVAAQLRRMGFGQDLVDGELVVGDWGGTAAARAASPSAKQQEALARAVFYVFDRLPPGGRTDRPLRERYAALARAVGRGSRNVRMVPHAKARSDADVQKAYHRFLGQGFEGAMVKDPDAGYAPRRSNNWLKLKPQKTLDGRVVGFQRGTGRLHDRLGALVVQMPNGTRVKVGTGMTDAQRLAWWQSQDRLRGKWVEFAVQGKTTVSEARHPRFKRFRPDRDGRDPGATRGKGAASAKRATPAKRAAPKRAPARRPPPAKSRSKAPRTA